MIEGRWKHRARWVLVVAAALVGCAQGDAVGDVGEAGDALQVAVLEAVQDERYERLRRFVGRVEFGRASELSFERDGRIAVLGVDEGDAIEAGAVLARLDTARLDAERDELRAARAEAAARLELAVLRDGRARELVAEDVISPQRADDRRLERTAAEAALARVDASLARVEVELAKSVLVAPFAGELSARRVDDGVVVRAGEPIVRLLEVARPELRVGVSPEVAAGLTVGERWPVEVGGTRHDAEIVSIVAERSERTRTVAVRLALPEHARNALRAGDLGTLAVRERVDAAGLWLPRSALTEGQRGLWAVFVAPPGDAQPVERRPVELLFEEGDRVFVRGGVRAGESVVAEGTHRLVPGQLVRARPFGEALARRADEGGR